MQKMTFIDYIQLLRLFITLRWWIHNDMYNEILKKYTIKNIDIADITIESLSPRTSMPHWYTKYGDIWEDDIQKNEQRAKDCFLDAPLTLCLCYKWEQIALIAGMLWHYDTFVIHQMQTISSHVFTSNWITKPKITHPLVQVLDWQNILFECMKYTVDSLGVKKTYIQPWEMNHRTKEMYTIEIYNRKNNQIVSSTTTDIPHLSKEIAHKIYDVFAEERWFTKDATWFWKEKKYLRKNNTTSKRLSNTA